MGEHPEAEECEECGKEVRPAWTSHRGRQPDLHFCSDDCRSAYRMAALVLLTREMEDGE